MRGERAKNEKKMNSVALLASLFGEAPYPTH